MIKITYKQEPYHYDFTGGQPYDIETVVTLNEDISADMAIRAFLRLLNVATYHVTLKTLKNLVEDLETEGYADDDRIM
jgi:hypothetical protein